MLPDVLRRRLGEGCGLSRHKQRRLAGMPVMLGRKDGAMTNGAVCRHCGRTIELRGGWWAATDRYRLFAASDEGDEGFVVEAIQSDPHWEAQ